MLRACKCWRTCVTILCSQHSGQTRTTRCLMSRSVSMEEFHIKSFSVANAQAGINLCVHRVVARRAFLATGRRASYAVQLMSHQTPQGLKGECSLSYTHQGCILRAL